MADADEPGATGQAWYAVVDTARDPALHPLVTACRDVRCLVAGTPPDELAATLPHLVRLHRDEPFLHHWREHGIGRGWGILLQTDLASDALRLQLKKYLNVRLPDGAVVWFRFYDPLILRTLLHASDAAELAPWFRDVARFVVEGECGSEGDDPLRQLSFDGGRLVETAFAFAAP